MKTQKNQPKKRTVSITLDHDTWYTLQIRAQREKRTLSAQVDYILFEYFKEHPTKTTTRKKKDENEIDPDQWAKEHGYKSPEEVQEILKTKWVKQ